MKSVGLRNGIFAGLLLGLSLGLIQGQGLLYGLSVGLPLGLSYGPLAGLSVGLNAGLNSWRDYELSYGLIQGLSLGLSAGLLSVLLIGKPVGIFPTDELVWSWRSLGRSLLAKRHRTTTLYMMVLIGLVQALSLVVASLTGSASSVDYFLKYPWLIANFHGNLLGSGLSYGLATGLSFVLSFWLLLGLFQGVSSETISDQHRVVPNQGIRRSAFNGLVLGLVSTAIVMLSFLLSFVLLYWLTLGLSYGLPELLYWLANGTNVELGAPLPYWLANGLSSGLSVGLLVGLLDGGLACLRHYVLRLLLWRAGAMPWNYPRFLDYAAEHILLRKVGGGYIFVHRLLLEYFASLDTPATPDAARAKREQR